jgi:tetratricopeptide (TPR) repeat protein
MLAIRYYAALILLLACWSAARADEYEFDDDDATGPPVAENAANPPNVFDLSRSAFAQQAVIPLFSRGEYDKAARLLERSLRRNPRDSNTHYNLACARARQGKTDEAFASLQKAVELGFRDAKHIQVDDDLASLRQDARFAALVKQAADAPPVAAGDAIRKPEPAAFKDGQVTVSADNTAYDPRINLFLSAFKIEKPDTADKPIAENYGKAGERLAEWYKEGTAAGNHGDLYDNRDRGHSFMNFKNFPELTRVIYSEDVQKRHLDWGLQRWFMYNATCIGNSSTAQTNGPFWRCNGRMAQTDAGVSLLQYLQYVNRHLYVYPVHVDNNPGHNGADGKGFGDVVPANTPYLLLSQGSSGSDIVFLDALVATLAAFRPEVKQELSTTGTLMPTVQMIFRSSNKTIGQPEDYLTGKAHPTAFEGSQVDAEKMVTLAHSMTEGALPPMVQLQIVDEDKPVVGRDYFDVGPREHLLDTPCAIARIVKSSAYTRQMILSAGASKDLRDKPLTFKWVVLRGDADRIRIKPIDDNGSQVELEVDYQPRRPIAPGSERESNRVDIGVFAHNGVYYSAPAFICFYTLDNEKRAYDDQHRIQVVDYTDPETRGNYVDPMLDMRKDWRDEYHYAADGTPLGWTRKRGDKSEDFTAAGNLVLERDADGKVTKTAAVRYVAAPGPEGTQVIKQELVDGEAEK